jgi:hypothetical protein
MATLGCCPQGRTLEQTPARRFCSFCGAAAPPWPLPAADPAEAPWTPAEERTLRKALADIWDGHLGLWGHPGSVIADRVVFGLRRRDWIAELLRRGWVADGATCIPRDTRKLGLTEVGLAVYREYEAGRR